jgi:HTH-type transcriptional regulator / antitoxin HigA
LRMATTEISTFDPDWVSPPGDTIRDLLEERSWSLAEFGKRLGWGTDRIDGLLNGETSISFEIALDLEQILGASANFWTIRESQYRASIPMYREHSPEETPEQWLAELPVADMRQQGWLPPDFVKTDPFAACLQFFDVRDIGMWRSRYHDALKQAVFRTSPSFKSKAGAVAAWLRQGEVEAELIRCDPWDAERFKRALGDIRHLTRIRDPKSFLPKLTQLCAECGVAVAIVRAPKGCRASGATRFLSPTKALLLLSFRYLSDDHFWFTFFHEAGHLLLHGEKALFLEDGTISNDEESEANQFSASILVPNEFRTEFRRIAVDRHAIRNFAKSIGVSPGIVIGQLQHLGRARRNQLNNLKARYDWGDE